MVGVLVSTLVVIAVGIVLPWFGKLSERTYGSALEEYIVSRNPNDTSDVERLAREYDRKSQRSFL